MAELTLVVTEVEPVAPQIRAFRLASANGGRLPPFSAGAHLRFQLPLESGIATRHYSLVDRAGGAPAGADSYRIAVQREQPGRGGSRYMHEHLGRGARLTADGPINEFPLVESDGRPVLLAGGIGITPLYTMAAALAAAGRDFRLHYSGRSRSRLAFLDELRSIAGERLHVHADDDPGSRLDLEALLDRYHPADPLYVCGPQGMLDAVLAGARARGWPSERVHFELFTNPAAEGGEHGFELELRASGITLQVPPDKSILQVLLDAGLDPLFDCTRGECGVCTTTVLEGEVDHRDYVLSDAEKASNQLMQICVSRAKGGRLVLDL